VSAFETIRIVSPSGTGMGTKVFCAESGAEIQGIEKLSLVIAADDINRATVQIACASIDTNAKAEYLVASPSNGEMKAVRRIEFADGEAFDL
jgi:hypothetical protein